MLIHLSTTKHHGDCLGHQFDHFLIKDDPRASMAVDKSMVYIPALYLGPFNIKKSSSQHIAMSAHSAYELATRQYSENAFNCEHDLRIVTTHPQQTLERNSFVISEVVQLVRLRSEFDAVELFGKYT